MLAPTARYMLRPRPLPLFIRCLSGLPPRPGSGGGSVFSRDGSMKGLREPVLDSSGDVSHSGTSHVRASPRDVIGETAEERLREIVIDRSGLVNLPARAVESAPGDMDLMAGEKVVKSPLTPLVNELTMRIASRGPISVSEFMNLALGHPLYGYYITRDAFGVGGDFTTSPEISQVFGELMGVWCVSNWMAMGSPSKVRLVEIGPGRGTLMMDLLRAASAFPDFCRALQNGDGVRMVETSPVLRRLQQKTLKCTFMSGSSVASYETDEPSGQVKDQDGQSKHVEDVWENAKTHGRLAMRAPLSGISARAGRMEDRSIKVEWMREFSDVMRQDDKTPLLIVAQELFDALPIHQFEYNSRGSWVERLIDLEHRDANSTEEELKPEDTVRKLHHLRFVLSKSTTPAARMLLGLHQQTAEAEGKEFKEGDSIEVCAVGAALVQDITEWLSRCGGAAVFVDYGDNGPARSSLRGIKDHKFVHPLAEPGEVDLSADVDFHFLRFASEQVSKKLKNPVTVSETVTQGEFLRNMGIEARIGALLQATPDEEKQMEIFMAFNRLVEGDFIDEDTDEVVHGMGQAYKAMGLYAAPPNVTSATPADKIQIAGFAPIQQ